MMGPTILDQINTLSGQTIQLCYACHKCTSGCPLADEMEFGPDRMLRMLQLGEQDLLLESPDIWLCAGCETCGTRCPNGINIARVMDVLRMLAVSSGARIAVPQAAKFHRLFLGGIRVLGRTHEAALLGAYKLWSLDLLSDLDSGARLVLKGKVPLIPHPVRARREVERLFAVAARANRARLAGAPEPVEG